MCNQQRLRPACAYGQSDQSLCKSLEDYMTVELLTEHHLEFLSLEGGFTGWSESTLVKMPRWKFNYTLLSIVLYYLTDLQKFAPVKSIGQEGNERLHGDSNKQEIPTVPLTLRTDVPPPMIQGIPPPPLPNQVLPNMISISGTPAMLAGLPSFNTASQPMAHIPPPPLPIVSTHLPPPSLLSPPQSGGTLSGVPHPPQGTMTLSGVPLTNLVTADQVRLCVPSLYLILLDSACCGVRCSHSLDFIVASS